MAVRSVGPSVGHKSLPLDAEAGDHEVPLDALHDFKLHGLYRGGGALHFEDQLRLDGGDTRQACHLDVPARHGEEWPYAVQHRVHLRLRQEMDI